jgi:MFS family permease
VPISFLWAHDLGILLVCAGLLGVFVSGQYTWMSAWLPELFPTRVRATGAGFVFNMPRLIAWVGPLIAGTLIANFGGFGRAAMAISLIYIISLAYVPIAVGDEGHAAVGVRRESAPRSRSQKNKARRHIMRRALSDGPRVSRGGDGRA